LPLFAQSAVYGAAHLALPLELVISVTLLGILLGGLALWQRSLVPGMILHAAIGLSGPLASSASE
jgi:membrane protease YdiL (CAAX protease family)